MLKLQNLPIEILTLILQFHFKLENFKVACKWMRVNSYFRAFVLRNSSLIRRISLENDQIPDVYLVKLLSKFDPDCIQEITLTGNSELTCKSILNILFECRKLVLLDIQECSRVDILELSDNIEKLQVGLEISQLKMLHCGVGNSYYCRVSIEKLESSARNKVLESALRIEFHLNLVSSNSFTLEP